MAQEVVKHTGKYTPLKQWIHFDVFEIVPDESADREPMGCRYDDQIRILGRDVHNKLRSMNLFLVGAGALGCEFLKGLSLMGCSTDGLTVVTDDDTIEVSNLNRQFLFRRDDVKHSKSERASAAAKVFNDEFNVEAK